MDRPCRISVLPGTGLPQTPVSDYVSARPACPDLVASGLIDPVMASCYGRIDDPARALADLLGGIDGTFDAIFVATSTCHWSVTGAVDLGAMLRDRLVPGGQLRFLTGKGCNTGTDAIAMARSEILSGAADDILILSVDACPEDLNRLQGYAFFSDHCTAIQVSSGQGTHRLSALRNGMAPYAAEAFSNTNAVAPLLDHEDTAEPLPFLTLNCFDFVLRYKYGGEAAFGAHLKPPFEVHHFGADPFLVLAGSDAPKAARIHVESPPGHVSQLVLEPETAA